MKSNLNKAFWQPSLLCILCRFDIHGWFLEWNYIRSMWYIDCLARKFIVITSQNVSRYIYLQPE